MKKLIFFYIGIFLLITMYVHNNTLFVSSVIAQQHSGIKIANNETGTVTDIDGNIYQTVKIGDQWWMAENLKVTHYRNGDTIPNVTESSQWINLSTGAYCAYNNNEANAEIYGYLYNWFAVNDDRNIAPDGWHIPTVDEWKILVDFLGGYEVAGGKMKEAGTLYWNQPNTDATNESGFNALPGGMRLGEDEFFTSIRAYGFWWTVTEFQGMATHAYNKYLKSHTGMISTNTYGKKNGYSIRCVKDDINSGLENENVAEIPHDFTLHQNYPNPFNPSTTIKYNLQNSSNVELKIFDLAGKEIETLINGFQTAGEHETTWQPEGLPSGIYFYRLQSDSFSETKKLILQK